MLIDEADYLSDGSLELVRRVINDKAQTGVVLAGLPRLKYKLENLRNDHQQLTSRVGVFLEVKRMGKPDAVKIIDRGGGLARPCQGDGRGVCENGERVGADAGQADGARPSGDGDQPAGHAGRGGGGRRERNADIDIFSQF
jgi:hypothetical protein